MKVTFCTREYDNVSGGQNTWLCRFLPNLRRRGIEPRVLCLSLSCEKEFPTVRSLRQAGINCTTVSQEENRYTEQRVRWLLERLAEDPPDVFVANMVIPAAYYAGRLVRQAGIPTVEICHVGAHHLSLRWTFRSVCLCESRSSDFGTADGPFVSFVLALLGLSAEETHLRHSLPAITAAVPGVENLKWTMRRTT